MLYQSNKGGIMKFIGLIILCLLSVSCDLPNNVNPQNSVQLIKNDLAESSIKLMASNNSGLNSYQDGSYSSNNPIGIKIPENIEIINGNIQTLGVDLIFDQSTCHYNSNFENESINPESPQTEVIDPELKPDQALMLTLATCSNSMEKGSELTVYNIALHIDVESSNEDASVRAQIEVLSH
jgi:hypothetical protein